MINVMSSTALQHSTYPSRPILGLFICSTKDVLPLEPVKQMAVEHGYVGHYPFIDS